MTIAQSLEHSWIKVRWLGQLPLKDSVCDKVSVPGRSPGCMAWVVAGVHCVPRCIGALPSRRPRLALYPLCTQLGSLPQKLPEWAGVALPVKGQRVRLWHDHGALPS